MNIVMTVNMISEEFDMNDVKQDVFVYGSKEECPAVQTAHFSEEKLMYWCPTLSQSNFILF